MAVLLRLNQHLETALNSMSGCQLLSMGVWWRRVMRRYPERIISGSDTAVRILRIDDDLASQFALSMLLKSYGYRVDVAGNGSEALDLPRENDFTVVLMDCMMPVMGGRLNLWSS